MIQSLLVLFFAALGVCIALASISNIKTASRPSQRYNRTPASIMARVMRSDH